jgi:hypothetical protein
MSASSASAATSNPEAEPGPRPQIWHGQPDRQHPQTVLDIDAAAIAPPAYTTRRSLGGVPRRKRRSPEPTK